MTSPKTESEMLGGAHVLAAEGFMEAVRVLRLHETPLSGPPARSEYEGRGGVAVIDLQDGSGRALVRRYRHGGLSGLVFGTWFAGRSRAVREFRVTLDAFASGVPCAQPLAAITRRTLWLFYRAAFVSREIPGSFDLVAMAKRLADGSIDRALAAKAVKSAARAVAAMHDRGFLHADLNLKNIVVSPDAGGFSARIVDFDLSRKIGSSLSRGMRMRNLMRLERSARKFAGRGLVVPPRLRMRFLREYTAASGIKRLSRAEIGRGAWVFVRHYVAWFFFR